MEFDEKNIITRASCRIGWFDYFADSITQLEILVREDYREEHYGKLSSIELDDEYNVDFFDDNGTPYRCFYPIEEGKEEKEMALKDEIIDIIEKRCGYAYCDNCSSELGDDGCDYCHRKDIGWHLSPNVIEEVANEILKRVIEEKK